MGDNQCGDSFDRIDKFLKDSQPQVERDRQAHEQSQAEAGGEQKGGTDG